MHRTPRIWLRDLGGDSFRKVLTAQVWEPEVDSPELRWRSQAETKWFLQFAASQPSLLSELCVHERLCLRKKKSKTVIEERQDTTSTSAFHTHECEFHSTRVSTWQEGRGEFHCIWEGWHPAPAWGRFPREETKGFFCCPSEDILSCVKAHFLPMLQLDFTPNLTQFPVSSPMLTFSKKIHKPSSQLWPWLTLEIFISRISHGYIWRALSLQQIEKFLLLGDWYGQSSKTWQLVLVINGDFSSGFFVVVVIVILFWFWGPFIFLLMCGKLNWWFMVCYLFIILLCFCMGGPPRFAVCFSFNGLSFCFLSISKPSVKPTL